MKRKFAALFFICGILCCGFLRAQPVFSSKIQLGNNDLFSGFEMLGTQSAGSNLILAGTVAAYPEFNSRFQSKLIRYLHQQCRVKYFLVEAGQSRTELINEFITSSDSVVEKLLQSVSTLANMRNYRILRKYNLTLPDSSRIRFIGVDAENYSNLPIVRISQLLPEDSIPDRLRIPVEALEGAAKYIITRGLENYEKEKRGEWDYSYYYSPSTFSVYESLHLFVRFFDSLNTDFRNWLGNRYEGVAQVVARVQESNPKNNNSNSSNYYSAFRFENKVNFIYQQVNKALKDHPTEKMAGLFDLCNIARNKLETACDFNEYEGLACRLRENPDSRCKNPFCLGIFYEKDIQYKKNGAEKKLYYQESVHKQYNCALAHLLDSVPESSARFVYFGPNQVADSVPGFNYDLILLNHNYPVSKNTDTTDLDSSVTEKINASSWLQDYQNARILVGYEYNFPFIDLGKINAILIANGLDGISALSSRGISLSIPNPDRMFFKFYYGQNNSGNYQNGRFQLGIGGNYLHASHFKGTLHGVFGYVKHSLTIPASNPGSAFFSNYKPPKVLTNPALYGGLGTAFIAEWAPVFFSAEGGLVKDFSNSRWKQNGEFTGTNGTLNNTGFYYCLGMGVNIKLEWFDKW